LKNPSATADFSPDLPAASADAIAFARPTPGAAWGMVGILVLASVFSFIDRQILTLLVQPIRADLHIGDTEISLLQGLAFTIFYSVLGLPLGRYADRGNRRNMIIVGIGFWSLMTMCCGLADSYGQLFLARIGVGVGEAALAPAAYSLICDAFAPRKRGTALGVYSSAIYLGIGMSIVVGGVVIAMVRGATSVTLPLLGELRSWQAAFVYVGLPGLLMLPILLLIREPQRDPAMRSRPQPPLREGWRYARSHRRAFVTQLLGYAFIAMAAYAFGSWVPTYFIRVHGWLASEAGIRYGLAVSLFGTLGGVLGGWLADRWLHRGRRDARLLVTAAAPVMWIPLVVAAMATSDARQALLLAGAAAGFSSMANSLGPTTLQDMVPPWLRGQATAVFFFVVNLLGLSVGPTAVALFTDRVFHDDAMLGRSIVCVVVPAILIGTALVLSGRRAYLSASSGSPT